MNRILTSAVAGWLIVGTLRGQAPKQVKSGFRVSDPIVSQFEDGAALAATQRVVPGETVFFRFSAADFKVGDTGKIIMTGHVQAFDPRGTAIISRDEAGVATSLREEDKDYRPRFHFQFQIPSLAPSGAYRIRFDATDDQTKATASAETTFQVDGRDVPASAQLVLRNFAFYRTADDEAPARSVAYRSGDMVWVKFDITGYKHGEQHAMDVAYDVTVTAPDGKQLFNQENAAVERNQAFYPQPWVPAVFSITLQPNMRPGEYAIAITAHDGIGKQTAVGKGVFRVE
ncbi:MAG: hypothetical protein EBY17_11875 [Acidobacteriia bacterium]|jgi:uncharacterized protein YfaS (alpha-2-macroglobulin family)|nr:hypothetical protein [Terriglobia bacterium]